MAKVKREVAVPEWGVRARAIFRLTSAIWGLLILATVVARIVQDKPRFSDVWPDWLQYPFSAVPVVCVAAGLVWLASAVVAGYRESD